LILYPDVAHHRGFDHFGIACNDLGRIPDKEYVGDVIHKRVIDHLDVMCHVLDE
jgi:hypothetical protein